MFRKWFIVGFNLFNEEVFVVLIYNFIFRPIQDAVVRNQTNSLSVHIAIWKNMGVDLNDILTEEDEVMLAFMAFCFNFECFFM